MRSGSFYIILFTCMFNSSFAQPVIRTDEWMNARRAMENLQMLGTLSKETGSPDAVGNPFLYDNWAVGKVLLYNNSFFDNVLLKFDVLRNKLFFNRNDTAYELLDDITAIKLKAPTDEGDTVEFRKIITGDKKESELFVQVLCKGKLPLYKQYFKRIEGENFTNGIVTKERKIVDYVYYWTIVNNVSTPVILNAHSLQELTADKTAEMQNFIRTKNINPKKEKQFAAAINYYNSLQ